MEVVEFRTPRLRQPGCIRAGVTLTPALTQLIGTTRCAFGESCSEIAGEAHFLDLFLSQAGDAGGERAGEPAPHGPLKEEDAAASEPDTKDCGQDDARAAPVYMSSAIIIQERAAFVSFHPAAPDAGAETCLAVLNEKQPADGPELGRITSRPEPAAAGEISLALPPAAGSPSMNLESEDSSPMKPKPGLPEAAGDGNGRIAAALRLIEVGPPAPVWRGAGARQPAVDSDSGAAPAAPQPQSKTAGASTSGIFRGPLAARFPQGNVRPEELRTASVRLEDTAQRQPAAAPARDGGEAGAEVAPQLRTGMSDPAGPGMSDSSANGSAPRPLPAAGVPASRAEEAEIAPQRSAHPSTTAELQRQAGAGEKRAAVPSRAEIVSPERGDRLNPRSEHAPERPRSEPEERVRNERPQEAPPGKAPRTGRGEPRNDSPLPRAAAERVADTPAVVVSDVIQHKVAAASQAANEPPASPAQPLPGESEGTPEARAATPLRELRLRVEQQSGGAVDVRFLKSEGDVKVVLRTADQALAQSISEALPEMTRALGQRGWAAEGWRASGSEAPRETAPREAAAGDPQGGRRQERSMPEWLEQIERGVDGGLHAVSLLTGGQP
jgi:hypothetical protein